MIFLAEVELALRQGHYERALAATDSLLATLNQYGMRAHMPEVLYLRGQIELARKTLREAQVEVEAIGSRRMLWQILFALSQLETDPIEANHLRQQARQIIEYIAANISDPTLRESFLNLAELQKLTSL